jgi:hypothetical protein
MKFKKRRSHELTLALIISFLFGCYPNDHGLSQELIGQKPSTPPSPKPSQRPRRQTFTFKIPKGVGSDGKREGAGTRGSCANERNKPNLTALIPSKNMGLTIGERPTFWFYVPYQASSTTPVEFTLEDLQGKEIYKQNLQLKNTPGVIGVTIPKNVSALEVDKVYEWKLFITCNPKIDTVRGRIKRVKPSAEVSSQLQASKEGSRLIIYAENGYWYDTLTGLIELRQNPQDKDFQADWEDLLKSDGVRLESIVKEPIVSCCKSK